MGQRSPLFVLLFVIPSCQKDDVARTASAPTAAAVSTQVRDTSRPTNFIAIKSRKAAAPKTLKCNSPVTQRDTLTILMPQPHGDYLTIKYPGGQLDYVVFPALGDSSRQRLSLMESKSFRSLDGISLIVGVTNGMPWVAGQKVPRPLMDAPGKYRVFVGENLESDFNPSEYHCDVRVVPNHSGS